MAKSKPDPKPGPAIHRIRLELSSDHRDRLRVLAAKAGISMAAFARAVLIREIEKGEK